MPQIQMLRSMMLIRSFEQILLRRDDYGFQLLSSGEEAVAVGVCAALTPDDQLFCCGRSIGPALARGLDPALVLAELIGKEIGPCRGRGGRGHLALPSAGFFGAHAVVGGNLAVAAGVALAFQAQGHPGIVACIFGDGACGAGALHETLNIAAIWNLPLILVCNNNRYSVSTPRSFALAPRLLSDLAKPFGVSAVTVDGMDVVEVGDAARTLAAQARSGGGPAFLECLSHRFASHSTATRETRSRSEIAMLYESCPIRRHASLLISTGEIDQKTIDQMQEQVTVEIAKATRTVDAAPFPNAVNVLRDVV